MASSVGAQVGPAAALPAPPALPAAIAQSGEAQRVSLAEVLQAARRNLDVSMARRQLTAAQGDVLAADHAPAPLLSAKASSIDLQNGVGGGNVLTQKRIDKAIGLDWTWERGNKRELRTRGAQQIVAAAQTDIDDITLQQQLAASAAFYDLLSAQERILEVGEIASSATQLAATAARRVQAGDLSAQDAARTDIEAQRARTELLGAQLDRQRAALVLGQLTGLRGDLAAQRDWPTPAAETPGIAPTMDDVEGRADVRAAAQRVLAAQAAVELASAAKKADVTFGTSLNHYPGTSTRLLELRLQVPLYGVLGGYNFQGEVMRAQAQLNLAEDMLERTRRNAQTEQLRLQQDQQGAAARSLSYQGTIVPRARQVADMAEMAYRKGAMSLTELIDARRTLRTILIEDLAARTDYAKAVQARALRQAARLP